LKNKSNRLQAETTCENVDVFRFTEAVVDNFAPIQKQQKWAGEGQRYWVNKEFWGGAGHPMFVFIGGEGQESCSRLTSKMYMYELAKQHRAVMINVEHRFYGESYPTLDMSTDNLQYLSSQQALADLARVINHVKTEHLDSPTSEVITVGGSYPGNMAAWFKLKYPSVTLGSIASSAPLTSKTNFYEYMEVVGDAINYFSGPQCFAAFDSASRAIMDLAAEGPGSAGYATLEKDYNVCSSMTDAKDLTILLSDLMGNVQGTIQYNNEHNGVLNVTDICGTMLAGPNAYDQFSALSAQYLNASGLSCENANWADTVAYLADPKMDPTNAGRPWTYQTCNEFGYFQTADSENQPFHAFTPLNMQFYRDLCFEAFNGWTSDPQVDWMNQVYGDISIAGTNIIFPAGTIDPWHALGETNSTVPLANPTENALYMLGTAHCNDLYAAASSDPESLTYARQVIKEQVSKWLARAQ
jgi:serine protease 16